MASRVPTKFSPSLFEELSTKGEITVSPDIQILLAPTVIPALIEALELQKNLYEKNFSKIAAQGGLNEK